MSATGAGPVDVEVVVPTIGRPSLLRLLESLTAAEVGVKVSVVDDRADRSRPLTVPADAQAGLAVEVLRSGGSGPAGARNVGWRAASAEWVAFLDDDVVVPPGWFEALQQDLRILGPTVGGSQGRILVPLPSDRRPTDWERNVAALEGASWATADLAYRRTALAAVAGFDERFPRAYREDADLALRLRRSGWQLVVGSRRVQHPVRPAPWHVSIAKQAGNADDALMDRLHGAEWRDELGVPRGARRRHLLATGAALVALAAGISGRRRVAAGSGVVAVALVAHFAAQRIAAGPRTAREVASLVATSVAIPPAATAWWLRGLVRARWLAPTAPGRPPLRAVLFDRDGTLVEDVPYNGDPDRVRLRPGAADAVDRVRRAGLRLGLVSNQRGVALGILRSEDVDRTNRRLAELVGPFDVVAWCPHDDADGCDCRKPRPGLVLRAASHLGVDPAACAVIGDIGSDIEAARSAGAVGLLVPTPATRLEEVAASPLVFPTLEGAVDHLLDGHDAGRERASAGARR